MLLIFIWTQYRHFYQVDNITFTIWKQFGGDCYITPYRYWWFSTPKKDYIKTSNVGGVLIHINEDSTLIIFNNCYINDDVKCHFTNYKNQCNSPDPSNYEEIKAWNEKRNSYRDSLPFIEIDVREMNVFIQNFSELKENK